MATLTVDTPRAFGQGVMNDLPVIADDIIYEGAMVGENASGYSRPLVAGDPFQGVCVRQADNTDGAAGDINVKVKATGILAGIAVTGATAVTMNDFPPVYASDDGTLTTTAGSNTLIGNISRWISSGVADVRFDTPRPPTSIVEGDIGTGAVTAGKIGADAVTSAKIGDDQVSLEHLDAAITPTHVPLYGGQITTGGGNVAEAETINGIAATDYAIITIVSGTAVYGSAACTTNTLTVTFDTDPSTDTVYNYLIFRAAA